MRNISWLEFHSDCIELAHKLEKKFDTIVAVTRGGLFPAGIIATELDIKSIETVGIVSYDDALKKQKDMMVLKHIGDEYLIKEGNNILVVDDLVDSGNTVMWLQGLLPYAHFAVVYAKPAGRHLVDTFCKDCEQDVWLHFPWEK